MTKIRCLVALFIGMIVQSHGSVLQTPTIENPVNVAPRAIITASSVYQNDERFGVQRLVDGSISPDWANSWQAQGTLEGAGPRGTLPAWLKFDLVNDYKLSGVSLFNTMNVNYYDTGTKDFNVQVSSDDINYYTVISFATLDWQNSTYQDFQFNNLIDARYVQINILSAYSFSDTGRPNRAGLNEAKIIAVPEPTSLSLLALGSLALVLNKRRRA